MTIARPLSASWITAVAVIAVYLAIGRGIDAIVSGTSVAATTYLTIGIGALVAGVSSWWGTAGMPRATASLEASQRAAIVAHRVAAGPALRASEWTGRVVNTATDAVERNSAYRATFIGPMLASLTVPVIVLVSAALTLDPRSALWLALVIPFIPLTIGAFQGAFKKVSTRYRAASRQLSAQYLDAIQGLSTLRALGAGRERGRKLAGESENVRQHVMRLLAGNQLVLLITDAVFSLGVVTVATLIAVGGVRAGTFTPGQAVSFLLLATLLLEPLDRIGQFFYVGMGGIAAGKEIRAFLAEAHEGAPDGSRGESRDREEPAGDDVPAGDGARHDAPADDSPGPRHDAPAIELDDVTFAYPGEPAVLHDAELSVGRGEKVAIEGRSGAGKTTILELLQRTWQPQRGAVRIDGVDLATAPARWARSRTAVVAQSTYLFTGTVADNLRLAKPDATVEELWQALAAANLDKEVARWPLGIDTAVGERGLAVSGGQAQRIAIARALLKDAPIVLLDEPTSQVDLESEAAIVAALQRLSHGRTVLTVAHRAAAVAAADRALTLVNGHLVPSEPQQEVVR